MTRTRWLAECEIGDYELFDTEAEAVDEARDMHRTFGRPTAARRVEIIDPPVARFPDLPVAAPVPSVHSGTGPAATHLPAASAPPGFSSPRAGTAAGTGALPADPEAARAILRPLAEALLRLPFPDRGTEAMRLAAIFGGTVRTQHGGFAGWGDLDVFVATIGPSTGIGLTLGAAAQNWANALRTGKERLP